MLGETIDYSLAIVKQIPGNLKTDEKNDKDTEWEENKESASLFLKKVTVNVGYLSQDTARHFYWI